MRRIMSENFFAISNPDDRHCHIFQWTNFHSSLFIKVIHFPTKEIIWLRFGAPLYADVKSGWKGANFILGSQEELSEYWEKLWSDTYTKDQFLRRKLFRVKPINIDYEFKIICAEAHVMEGLELEMHKNSL
jgi:hypothetical protein